MYGKLSDHEVLGYALRRNRSWWRGIINWGRWALVYGVLGILALEFNFPKIANACFCAVIVSILGAVVYYVILCLGIVKKTECKDADDIERYKQDVKRGKYHLTAYEEETYGL